MSDTSRDRALLHPVLLERWTHMQAEWARLHPDAPAPFLTTTYRGPEDQRRLKAEGRSRVSFGHSLHNFKPAYALDIAFLHPAGHADWSFHLFEKMAAIAEPLGLVWGGRWPGLVDGPHFQLPMTPADAEVGRVPTLAPLPAGGPVTDEPVMLVVTEEGETLLTRSYPSGYDFVMRYSHDRRRVYLDVRREKGDVHRPAQ